MTRALAVSFVLVAACGAPTGLLGLQRDARALRPLLTTAPARQLVDAVPSLPRIAPRTIWHDAHKTVYYTDGEAAALPAAERKKLIAQRVDEEFFYTTGYGSPLAYARPFELAGVEVAHRRILDFGFGGIGHLLLLASLGADAVGVDIDPMLGALYRAPPAAAGAGRVRTLIGRFPAEPALVEKVGDGYDFVISKNVLKRGYIHPAEKVPERLQISLGVDDESFVRTLYALLKPGGRAMIYNLSPAPAPPGKPYIPWADGRSPFPRALFESVGFRVLAFEVDDTPAARGMGHALRWDLPPDPTDLAHDLFAQYTLVERPAQ